MIEKIPCTLGILTFNSARTLETALESAREFAEILVADGGSTDDTLEIAGRYGCRIITQSNPGHPIMNFALERNRLLDAAYYDWFFYIDSDERISPELTEAIRSISAATHPEHLVYWVRYQKTNEDFSKIYRTFKEYYQPRFFNRLSGARFIRAMHERIAYDEAHVSVGRIEAPWYVSLDTEDLSFASASRKIRQRLGTLAAHWRPETTWEVVRRLSITPTKETFKSLFKILYVFLRYGREGIPVRYELLRIYSHWVKAILYAQSFWKRKWTQGMV